MTTTPDAAHRSRVMAHRGDSEQFPEQTRAAFVRALEVGADGIECDVHLSADGELVLLHDQTVDRTSDGSGPVGEWTLARLRELDWGSWRSFGIPGDSAIDEVDAHRMLTLGELIELMLAAGRPLDLAIETKHPSPFGNTLEDAVLAELARVEADGGLGGLRIRIITFDRGAAEHLRAVGSPYPLELLVDEIDEPARNGRLPNGVATLAPAIEQLREHPETVAVLAAAGHDVHPWTVDDLDDARFAQALGCSIITTNRPSAVMEALR